MIPSSVVVAEARTWLDTPFLHQGRTRLGVDCVGLVLGVLRAVGLEHAAAEPAAYRRAPDGTLIERVRARCSPAASPEPGVLVVIRWPQQVHAAHVALCTGTTLVHSYERAGRVVEHSYRRPWVGWTHSLWRLPGVAYE